MTFGRMTYTAGGRRLGRVGLVGLLTVALPVIACGDDADDTTEAPGQSEAIDLRTPTVDGPVTGGEGVSFIGTDVSSAGYVQEEFFFEGDASAYEPVGDLDATGGWAVEEAEAAPFRTRLLVSKPDDPADFNGTVFVEWFNVTAGFDNAPDWLMAHNQIVREGAVWIGVSAQAVGVEGGEGFEVPLGLPPLKEADHERYGTLQHPGDAFSYDIFTQAGTAALGEGDGSHPLDGYAVEHLIAMGESQSAFRLTTYVNAVHPLVDVYDGFLIHSRRGEAAPFGDQAIGENDPDMPDDVRIRDDLDDPVLTFQTESELVVLGFAPARQPDSGNFRLWEVAGTAHVDAYTAGPALTDLGDGAAELTLLDPSKASGGPLGCPESINAAGQHAVLSAALAHLEQWVRDGTAPPEAPRIETTGTAADATIVRDEHGIARGGIRTPIVDVPLATNDGEENPGGQTCSLFGRTRPLDPTTLTELYPNGSDDYQEAFDRAADETVEAGFWLEPEADNFKNAARQITLN